MSAKWLRSNEVVWETLEGDALLVSPVSGARCALNATAAAIWGLCDGTRTLGDLTDALEKASGRSRRVVRAEIAAFCSSLSKMGLLRPVIQSNQIAGKVCFQSSLNLPPAFQNLGLGHGPRRRPSPRGNSGPG